MSFFVLSNTLNHYFFTPAFSQWFHVSASQKQGRFFLFHLTVLLAVLGTGEAKAEPTVDGGDPIIGKVVSESERCQECHGATGDSTDARTPKHTGQIRAYLIKQLHDFQTGQRQHAVMSVMAEDLGGEDIKHIAAYFSSQPLMQGNPSGDYPIAKRLFFQGDLSRGIRPCSQCHGTTGKGGQAENTVYPVIGGQNAIYLRVQLVNWKLGERTNSPGGVMNTIAKNLTDEEIDALVNYLSGL